MVQRGPMPSSGMVSPFLPPSLVSCRWGAMAPVREALLIWAAMPRRQEIQCSVSTTRPRSAMSSRVAYFIEIEFSHRAKMREARKMRTSLIRRRSRSMDVAPIRLSCQGQRT